MGPRDEQDDVIGGKGETEIKMLKQEVENIVEGLKSLKAKNESHHRSIVGLTTEKEDVRLRIRALLNKRIAAQGPDFDEYKINRKTSRTYEPIDAKTRKRSTSSRKSVTSTTEIDVDSQPALPASVTVTVQAN